MNAEWQMGGHISDPVHSYVDFTGIERMILDTRIAQRLRYVAQNGLNHLVFPEVRTSRFSHSLGTMHVASAFLSACLKNAEDTLNVALCRALGTVVDACAPMRDASEAAVPLSAQPALIAYHYCSAEADTGARSRLLIAEQALRLAALLHDLGHLPFSHDFEFAIEELLAAKDTDGEDLVKLKQILEAKLGSSQLHERLGQGLGLNLMKELVKRFGDSAGTLDFVFTLAFRILTATADSPHDDQTKAVEFLHTIIAGEVDADRCDYVFRDGRNYGFEFATYDLNRILQNIIVVDGRRFEICFKGPIASIGQVRRLR